MPPSRILRVIPLLLLGLAVLSVPSKAQELSSPEEVFAIQVEASEDTTLIASLRDSLDHFGLPIYTTQEDAFHRLRVGPFLDRADAERFAAFHQFEDYWVGAATGDGPFENVVTEVIVDAATLEPRAPYVYVGQRHPFVALRHPRSPRAVMPTDMSLYVPGRPEPLTIDNATGLQEEETALSFGISERVFVNPRHEAVERFAKDIEAFSREHELSRHVVEEGLAYYDSGVAARFTLLGAYDFERDTLLTHEQPGFDYVGANGQRERFTGAVKRQRDLLKGNVSAWPMTPRGSVGLRTDHAALYARPSERGDTADLCIVFFRETP